MEPEIASAFKTTKGFNVRVHNHECPPFHNSHLQTRLMSLACSADGYRLLISLYQQQTFSIDYVTWLDG